MKKYIILIGFILVGQLVLAQQRITLKSINVATKLNIADTANMRVRPIAGTNVTITGTYPNLTFNASGGGGSATDTSSLSNRINSKLSISDSAAMLSNYQTAINQRLKISDTASMLSGYGTAINQRLRITDTANIRIRPIAGTNTTITGTYPNLTFNATATPIDTSSLSNRINTKLAISDTSGMLSSYQSGINARLKISDTATMLSGYQSAINLKLKISDTSAMLGSYQTAINQRLKITDTANMRVRPIAGTNVTITGTYPNLTFNASGGSSIDTTSLSNRINTKYDFVNFNADSTKYNFWKNNVKVDSIGSLVKNLYGVGRIILTDSSNGNGYIKLDTLGLNAANLTGLTTSIATLNNQSGTNTGDQTLPTLSSLGAVASNTAITGATNTKITYDAKGLVTAGAAATTADIAASTNKNYVTDAQQTVIGNTSGTNTGDNSANSLYSALVSNATHTGDATGSTALTVVKINGTQLSTLATGILKNTTTTGVPSIAVNSDLPTMSATVGGAVPTPPNNTTTFLRGDGTFAVPSGGSGDMILASPQTNTGVKTFDAGTLIIGANTTSNAVENFTLTGAALMTTPIAGDGEVDANGIRYYTPSNGARGVVVAEQFMTLTAPYTLTSQTAAQKIFTTPTNGAFNAKAATSYFFECVYSLSAMSATSGNFGFALGGTATITSINWTSQAIKQGTQTSTGTLLTTRNITAANLGVVAASTQTGGYATVKGIVRVNAAGTLIPSVSLGIAAAAIVGTDSYFRIYPIGTNTVLNTGNFQ